MKKVFCFVSLAISLFLASCANHRLTEKVINTYDNGQPAKVYYYNGEGLWVREADFYDDGALMMEGPIVNDLREGDWISYFRDGKVQSTGVYKDGLRVGLSKVYHENGHLWMDGHYTNDHKCGEWVFYDEQGYEIDRRDFGSCD